MILVSSESSTWRSAPKSQKLTFKKILRPSKQLRAKNEFSRKYANYTVRIVMGLGKVVDRVLTSQSQVNLYKKNFFRTLSATRYGLRNRVYIEKNRPSDFFQQLHRILHFEKPRNKQKT